MFVLSRKAGQKILVGGGVTVTILARGLGRVRVGVEVPRNVVVRRPDATKPDATVGDALPKKG